MRELRKFALLSQYERWQLILAWGRVCRFRLALALLPSRWVLQWGEAEAVRAERPASAASAAELEPLRWSIAAASRRVPGARCLAQALAARLHYARAGLGSELRFGGRKKSDGSFEAHAWLESSGQVVYGDARREQFTPIVPEGGRVSP